MIFSLFLWKFSFWEQTIKEIPWAREQEQAQM